VGESKSQLDICAALASKLGITDFSDKTDEELVRQMVAKVSEETKLPDYDQLKNFGIYRLDLSAITPEKPEKGNRPRESKLRTPSGKIEISSEIISRMNSPDIPSVPEYLETWEGLNDHLSKKYPLQLISPHIKRRAHSQFDNLPWLRELQVQALSINTIDAEARNIRLGDTVRIYNDRGEVRIPARITERIMPGVVALPQGAWFRPDEKGIDHGGCANVLTKNVTSPGGAFPSHTALVEVEKVLE
jgi:anaerobic dimethyl sulfoxide reductase subunit A